jgi:nicotinamide/nicotinate riboside kinase
MPHHHHPTTPQEIQASSTPRNLIIALSGPSCSGKTTLARLLRDALAPHAFILHEDDFYKTDAEIPIKKVEDGRELQDWDCLESLDLKALEEMLVFIKAEGQAKESFESKEDQNAVGDVKIDAHRVDAWKEKFASTFASAAIPPRIAIIDGFLLFSEEMKAIRELFDVRLLLRLDYDTVKSRRERRMGYVTLEGFWEDPKGYVDLIVWPNYVKDHAFLFKDGNVNGELHTETCESLRIQAIPKDAVEDMTLCFHWAAGIVYQSLQRTDSG